MDPIKLLQDIDEANCREPTKTFCNYKYDYARCITTLQRFFTVSPKNAPYAADLHNVYEKKLLEQSCSISIIGRHHRHRRA